MFLPKPRMTDYGTVDPDTKLNHDIRTKIVGKAKTSKINNFFGKTRRASSKWIDSNVQRIEWILEKCLF